MADIDQHTKEENKELSLSRSLDILDQRLTSEKKLTQKT